MKKTTRFFAAATIAGAAAMAPLSADAWWWPGSGWGGPWGGGPWGGNPWYGGGYPYYGGYPGWGGYPAYGYGYPGWGGYPAYGYGYPYAPAPQASQAAPSSE
ncbi:MAG: hypothetical protein C0631_17945 [Sedimenticola sp.]|nr:MAG: hypothetical protein C0631_17945 [Sedimenticola sp.]